jgi:hypothetical protein
MSHIHSLVLFKQSSVLLESEKQELGAESSVSEERNEKIIKKFVHTTTRVCGGNKPRYNTMYEGNEPNIKYRPLNS